MTEEQKRILRRIIEIVEETKSRRIILDFVVQLIEAQMEEKDAFLEAEFAKYQI